MNLKATVTFDDNADPVSFRVVQAAMDGHRVSFNIVGTTAVATTVEPPEGEAEAHLSEVKEIVDYADRLPFVQSATLAGPGELHE